MTGNPFQLCGSVTAMATPFCDGQVDDACLARLCERQIERGTAALLVCGSTGEASALRRAEYEAVICTALEAAAERVPVLAGCGALSTEAAAELGSIAARCGVQALLCAPPPYCKPTQAGLLGHLREVRETADLPILLYDVPGRTGIAIADDTVAEAFELGLVFGIKDASGDLARPPRLRALCGDELDQLAGDDAVAAAHLAMGGCGCVSVVANLFPAMCAHLQDAWRRGDMRTFAQMRDLLSPVAEALFVESNPIPLKAALELLDLAEAEVRLPLTLATAATEARLTSALATPSGCEEVMAARHRFAVVR